MTECIDKKIDGFFLIIISDWEAAAWNITIKKMEFGRCYVIEAI